MNAAHGGKKWLVLLALPAVFVAVLWWQRTAILEWHYVRCLASADAADAESWAEHVAGLDLDVLPRLIAVLGGDDARACGNVEAALVCMLRRWGPDDPRGQQLTEALLERFSDLSSAGQNAVLRVPLAWLGMCPARPVPATMTTTVSQFLTAAMPAAELRARAVLLGQALVHASLPGQWTDLCRELVRHALKDSEADTRARAIQLLQQLAGAEPRFLAEAAPLLQDTAVEVRRAALIAVGPWRDAVVDDELLPLLHDADPQVRRLCEEALRSRGLADSHLLLARLISDPRPAARLQVIAHLSEADDLDVCRWLRRLGHDAAPAVRAAAARAAYYQTQVDMTGLLRQLASDDPSPTVRQLAEHYLRRPALLENDE